MPEGRPSLAVRLPTVTLAVGLLMLLIGVLAPEPSSRFDVLVLDRMQPHAWSWISAHLLHTDLSHLTWNVLALACLGWLGEPQARGRFVLALIVGMAAVDLWFTWLAPDLRFYCGLSGALNTVLLVTLYALRGTVGSSWLIGVAVAVAAKIGWELHTGVALFTHTRWPSAVGAHLAGYSAGLALTLGFMWHDRMRVGGRGGSL